MIDNVYVYEGKKWIILCNLENGNMDLLSHEEWNIIENNPTNDLKKKNLNLFKKLKSRGYLFSKEKEFHSAENNQLIVYMVMSQMCNLQCVYCNQWNMPRITDLLTPEKIDKAVGFIRKWIEKGNEIRVILFGGEPLLPRAKNNVKYLMEKLKNSDIEVGHITTNGTTISFYKDLLLDYKDIINNGFLITVDGPPDIHNARRPHKNGKGTFDSIVQNISWLIENEFHVKALTVLDKMNIDFLPQLAELYVEKEWVTNEYFYADTAKVMYPFGNIPQDSPILSEVEYIDKWHKIVKDNPIVLEVFSDYLMGRITPIAHFQDVLHGSVGGSFPATKGCSATREEIKIFSPDGFLYPCVEVIGWEKYAICEYFPQFKSLPALNLWSNWSVFQFEKCTSCEYITICGGTCPLKSIQRETMEYKSPSCPPIKKILDTYFLYAEEILIPKLVRKISAKNSD